MAIRSVGPTSTYPSISAAMLAAGPNDTIQLESGYSGESATVTQSGITVSGDAGSIGVALRLAAGIPAFTATGTAPFTILDATDGNGIVGNSGDNSITVSGGVDAVDGGAGTDRLVVDYHLATGAVTGDSTSNFTEAGGGARSVTITAGTVENFTVLTGPGADTITTGDGDDTVSVGAGANTVTAGNGANTVTSGDDADTITTGDGDDTISAGAGTNTVTAGQGANTVTGGSGADTITALDGGNFIDGGDGTNVLTSGDGNDTILSGTGAGTIVAGGGMDLVTVRGGAVAADAGAGDDRLIVDYSAATTDVTGGITGGDAGTGHVGRIADLVASSVDFVGAENFTVATGSGNDLITTGGGGDVLTGGGGDDSLNGGAGDDELSGGAGSDAVDGGVGADRAFYGGNRADYTISASGSGFVIADNRGGGDGTDTVAGVETFRFGDGTLTAADLLTGTPPPTSPVNAVDGTEGDDRLVPGGGDNAIDGRGGDDWVDFTTQGHRGDTVQPQSDGGVTLTHDGRVHTLRGVEEVRFMDGRLVFDTADPAARVVRLYEAALDRLPDQGGLNFWIGAVQDGQALSGLASGFLASGEFQSRFGSATVGNGAFVDRLYANVLGRDGEASGRQFWVDSLGHGASRADVLVAFSESAENKAGTAALVQAGIWDRSEAAGEVARLYDTVFGRLPDPPGLAFWKDALESGKATLVQVADAFTGSAEFRSTYGNLDNREAVSELYVNSLDRPAEQTGLDFWTGQLDAGVARSAVVLAFSESQEHINLTAGNIQSENPGEFGILFA